MSRRKFPSISDLNVQSEQPMKRLKISPTTVNSSSYRNIFEQFDDVVPPPSSTTMIKNTDSLISKKILPKLSSQQSSSTSSSIARSIMAKKVATRQNDELWSNLFEPKTRQDLVIHPKKIKELEEILQKSCEIIKTNKVYIITYILLKKIFILFSHHQN